MIRKRRGSELRTQYCDKCLDKILGLLRVLFPILDPDYPFLFTNRRGPPGISRRTMRLSNAEQAAHGIGTTAPGETQIRRAKEGINFCGRKRGEDQKPGESQEGARKELERTEEVC